MAIEKEVPQDTKKYEPKFIWIFTMRQAICFLPAALVTLVMFFAFQGALSISMRVVIALIAATPFILVGWVKPYNMPFEKFAASIFRSFVLSPAIRKYKTRRMIEDDVASKKKGKKKKQTKFNAYK